MVSRLNFHSVSVVVVLALVLVETFVESQYYLEESESRPLYVFNSDDLAHPAQPYLPPEEGRGFGGKVLEDVANAPGRMFAARKGRIDSSDEEDDEEEDSRPAPAHLTATLPKGRIRPMKLPPNFDDKVKKRMKMRNKSRTPLHGDPDPIDELDEEGRKPEARLLWPFSIEITKGSKDKGWDKGGGWGPGAYNSPPPYPHPPPRTGLGLGFGFNGKENFGVDVKHGIPPKQFGRIGYTKGRFPSNPPPNYRGGHFHASSGWGAGPQNGWGWDAFIEHEKHRLKYEILKLKAKKKIAVLQNKVELKKLFSMLLQKKIQALEWWYHDWMNSWNGWHSWGQQGWGGWGPISGPWGSWANQHHGSNHQKHPYGWKPGDLTDEEILNSKHYKKYRKKKKKKIKKLKKKLKFKRLVQKILQKHITYLDKIAPY